MKSRNEITKEILEKFLGNDDSDYQHLAESARKELKGLAIEQLALLLSIDSFPVSDGIKGKLKDVPNRERVIKILKICNAVKECRERGEYEALEHYTGCVLRNFLNKRN